MAIGQELGGYPDTSMTHEDLVDHVANMQKTVEFYLGGNLSTENAREFGGWQIRKDSLIAKNGQVGFHSGTGPAGTADPVRIWAGQSQGTSQFAPFRVYQSGKMVATDAEISGTINMQGGNIIWGNVTPPDYAQIVGSKPPADANNTYSELLFNSGIRGFVNVGGTLFLSADYIRGGHIVGDFIDGGTIKGTTINVITDLRVGNNVYIGDFASMATSKSLYFNSSSNISSLGISMQLSAGQITVEADNLHFAVPTGNITGLPGTSVAVFG